MRFARIYSDDQREALERAWGDAGIRPAGRIAALARAGELRANDGSQLEPFDVPEQTIRSLGARYLRRRSGRERSELMARTPRDALEQLRRRLVSALDHELEQLEREQRRGRRGSAAKNAGARLRELGRATRELAALPGANEPAAAAAPAKSTAPQSALARRVLESAAEDASP